MTLAPSTWARRVRADVGERLGRLRLEVAAAAQSGIAAGLAWFIAHNLLGHPRPFFAPIAAVIVLSAAVGQRWRRAVELVFGVAVGIAVGDVLVLLVGVGPIQIAVVVMLAILVVAGLGGGGGIAVSQAAASAVLVATLQPPTGGIYYGRFIDALVGGAVGIVVLALLLPFNPLIRVQRDAGKTLDRLSGALHQAVRAIESRDADRAQQGLDGLRAGEHEYAQLRDSLTMGQETAAIAPLRWRSRPALTQYVDAAIHIERATRNVRVLLARVRAMVRDSESVPEQLSEALRLLAEAVSTLRRELHKGEEPVRTRDLVIDAVAAAGAAYAEGVGFSGSVVVAQVRSAAVDLLVAAGLRRDDADRAIRRAATPRGRDRG
jgi:uncharacterized membrane protein YgaE (UPF0421/DUF939 family)